MQRLWLAALGVVALTTGTSRADGLRSVPLGGRTATMGGAGVAAGTDNAMPFLNPAGLAGIPTDLASISATAYGYAAAPIQRYYVPNGFNSSYGSMRVDEDHFDTTWFAITPSTAAYFFQLSPAEAGIPYQVLGLSVTTATYNATTSKGTLRAQGSDFTVQQDDVQTHKFIQYLAGPSYGVGLADGRVRIGVSALMSFGQVVVDDHFLILLSPRAGPTEFPQTANQRTLVDAWSVGLTAVAGVQAEVSRNVWLGLAAELNGLPITGGGTLSSYYDESVVDQATLVQTAKRNVARGEFQSFKLSRPARLSLGAAYEVEQFALAADAHYSPPWKDFMVGDFTATVTSVETGFPVGTGESSGSVTYSTAQVINGSLGVEYSPNDSLSWRFGLFTDRDFNEERDSAGELQGKLDWYGVTTGLGTMDGQLETTYGIAYRYGAGVATTADFYGSGRTQTFPFSAHGVMVMLSGSIRTSEGERQKAQSDLVQTSPASLAPQ